MKKRSTHSSNFLFYYPAATYSHVALVDCQLASYCEDDSDRIGYHENFLNMGHADHFGDCSSD